MKPRRCGTRCTLLGLALTLTAFAARAETPLSVQTQAKILLRALAYDRRLQERAGDDVVLALVFRHTDRASSNCRRAMEPGFADLAQMRLSGLPVLTIEHDYLSQEAFRADVRARHIDVVFLCAGLDEMLPDILDVTRGLKVPSLTSQADYVHAGASIGLVMRAGSPKLLVNLPASREEGLVLTGELMRLAEIVP